MPWMGSYQNSGNIRQFFQVILTIFSLHISGFIDFNDKLQDFSGFTRFYKSLWKLTIFHKTNEIFVGKIIRFHSFAMYFVPFRFHY